MEVWKDVVGHEGKYKVSNEGKVMNLTSLLSSSKRGGYPSVTLRRDGKGKPHYVHRLVAQAFLPNPEELPNVNHKDEDKGNPHVSNLEWCDQHYNMDYSLAKEYTLTSPSGAVYHVRGLYKFCREHELRAQHLSHRGKYKGWTCIKGLL